MSSTIIDETVILRYLLDDDEVLSPRAAKVIATRTARVYPEIITRVVVTLRDVYKVPRVEITAAMKRLLDDVMVDEPHRCRPCRQTLWQDPYGLYRLPPRSPNRHLQR